MDKELNNLHTSTINLTGKKFGKLLVLGLDHKKRVNYQNGRQRTTYFWKCKCECGNEVIRSGNSLRGNYTKSCGCYQREKRKETQNLKRMFNKKTNTKKIDLTGKIFGKLLVLGLDHKKEVRYKNGKKKTYYYWKCACVCGNEVIRLGESLRSGATKSCGCYKFYKQMMTNERKKYLKNHDIKKYEKEDGKLAKMKKTLMFNEEELFLRVTKYVDNGYLAIFAYTRDELYGDLTVNLSDFSFDKNKGFVNAITKDLGLEEKLIEEGIIKRVITTVNYNMGKYDFVEFDLEKLKEYDPEGVKQYQEENEEEFE